jgi:hypothetical protein
MCEFVGAAQGNAIADVTAAGYRPLVSPVVGAPPEVADLWLTRTGRHCVGSY